jgi:thiamine-phosphate pyrophosphorylase
MKEEEIKDRCKQIIDANANRAREGIRVIEEIARFIINNKDLTLKLKNTRHKLTKYVKEIEEEKLLLLYRDSESDVGAKINLESEGKRLDLFQLMEANFKRIEEAVRVLEEFLKLYKKELSRKFKEIRFEIYQIEKEIFRFLDEHS